MQNEVLKTMRPGRRLVSRARVQATLAAVAFVFAGLLSACTKESAAKPDTQQSVATATNSDIPAVLATIGDEKITIDDIRARAGSDLDAIETQYHRARSKVAQAALDAILREKVLDAEAKKQGKTVDELIAAEAGQSLTPSDEEVAAWYRDNPTRVTGKQLADIRPQIADFIRNQRRQAAVEKLQQRLNKQNNVTVFFTPYRLEFANEGAPTIGKPDAPVKLVEFSDFQCPFCHQFAPTLKQVEQKYGDKVQIVYRQFPLTTIHPFAFKAAEASLCAQEQGKFWEMHDAMFGDQQKLAVSDLKASAGRLGMDQKKFDGCLDTGKYTERVQKDMQEGQRVGITGTPAVFVNGAFLEGGAVPFETVSAAIDQELKKPKSN
jgi:protein-disulfide isomerase